jgi:dipeptidyl aminopeptidase/acylaminoacyl peptidase
VGVAPDTLVALQTGNPHQSLGDIAVMSIDGTQYQTLTAYGYNRDPRLSPDQQRIAYRSVPASIVSSPDRDKRLREGNYNLWVITTDGAQAWKLTDSEQPRSVLDWSPDSQKVLFSEGVEGALVEVEVDTQARREITRGAYSPRYRPSGGVGYLTEGGGLAWMDEAGTSRVLVPTATLPLSTTVSEFAWLPDGQSVIYTLMDQSGRRWPTTLGIKYSTWLIQVNDSAPKKLADDIHDLQMSPDGQTVAALLGSGWYDPCMVDLSMVFSPVEPDRSFTQLTGVERYDGHPDRNLFGEFSMYPLEEITWVSERLALGWFAIVCPVTPYQAGFYLVDPVEERVIQITRD